VVNRIPGALVEIVEAPPRGRIRHAVFDFDGTISNVRDGWQDFMVPMMLEVLAACGSGESEEEILACIKHFVDHLTGKQTIYQMLRLAEEIRKRGGTPLEPAEYKRRYHDRLDPLVRERLGKLRRGEIRREDLLVPGSVEFLEELRRRGVALYLASGTDIEFVRQEAAALGVDGFFGEAIFGALPNYQDFSKEKVIKKILSDFHLGGPELLVIGDGYVEIENARAVGAVALGIYTRENNRYHLNAQKRERLLEAGSHLLAPDLREARAILDYLEI